MRTWMEWPHGLGNTRRESLADHPLHQVDAGDLFGDAVLHLQAGVDFQEVKAAGVVVVDELHRAGGLVVDGFGQADGGGQQFAHCRLAGRGRLFDDFLIAALHGTIAFAQSATPSPKIWTSMWRALATNFSR